MSNTQHTPGPWRYDYELDYCGEIIASNGTSICSFTDEPSTNDARLIAAAPDLLEALESVWLWMENQADGQSKGGYATFDLMMLREQRDIARAAIAKATGETK